MSLNLEQALFMQHVAALISKAPEHGLLAIGGELYRTPEQQMLNIRNGRSKTMSSQHLNRLAIDFDFFKRNPDDSLTLANTAPEVAQLGAFWESLDPALNRWGGRWNNFKDITHFERTERSAAAPASIAEAGARLPFAPDTAKRGARLLGGTVGPRCQNQRDDVESVQRLINLNAERIGLGELLKPDGIIGNKTFDALSTFQRTAQGRTDADGTVRPGDACLLALCSALPAALEPVWLQLAWLNAAEDEVGKFAAPIAEVMRKYQINTPLRQAHFLAQVGHESGELRFRTELASGQAYEGRRDLGNTQPGDGPRYKGRGLIQLTGRNNYDDYTRTGGFGIDVVEEPDRIAQNEQLCVDVAGWFWDRKGLNQYADRDDLETVTRIINGGQNGLADRRRLLLRAKALMGLA